MKKATLLIGWVFAWAAAFAIAESPANSNQLYQRGLAAERAGDPDAARAAYQQALRANPNHADARFRLGQIGMRRDAIARQGRQNAFNAVMLPQILLDDAGFREALDALANMVEAESEGKVAPNFVIQDTDGKLAEAKITMQLRNVSAGAVLEYMLGMAKARARHDEFAIVIQPQ